MYPNSNINRYTRTRYIGSGAYSNVFEAIDQETGEIVAIKETKLNKEEGFPATSLREIHILKKVQHPNIIELLNIVHTENFLWLIFEYMDFDLKTFLENNRVDVVPYIRQLLCGVEALHSQNLIHRDLKPQNILVNKHGALKIGDFGLGRSIDIALPHYASEVVTLWYRSPELLRNSVEYEHYVDMWSVGCIIVEMICGNVLFRGDKNEKQLQIIIHALKNGIRHYVYERVGSIPDYLMDIICGCLDEDVHKRFTVVDCLRLMYY